jgi:hypothetical protein
VTTAPSADSTLGRLLQELSWEGASIRNYRDGGLGKENVLTAEVLTALDYLPRTAFLGAVLAAAHGADRARSRLMTEIEEAVITLLPDEVRLRPRDPHQQCGLVVQPDAAIRSPGCYVLVEAKRLRRSSFQPEQLAREYLAVTQDAIKRTPLLLLILGAPPPVAVQGVGRLSLADAIAGRLASVLSRMPCDGFSEASLLRQLPETVAWTTWHDLRQATVTQHASFCSADPSMAGTVERLVTSINDAIIRHS